MEIPESQITLVLQCADSKPKCGVNVLKLTKHIGKLEGGGRETSPYMIGVGSQ